MGKRLHELDSLRGLAAFAVMLSHLLIVFPIAWNTSEPAGAVWWIKLVMFSPLRVVWAGHEAVIFFFILSGFVLALPFFGGGDAPPYRLYLVKRIIRIYPPYLVAALSAMILRELFFNGPIPSVSDWFNQSWQSQVTPSTLLDHFTMIGSYNNCAFNPVLWSLVHEMRISIIFPLIAWTLIKHERLCLVLPLAFTLVYCLSISLRFRGLIAFDHDYFATLHYTGFFIVGAFLAKYREQIVGTALKIPNRFKWLLLGSAVLFYTNSFWLPYYVTPQTGSFALLLRKLWFQEWIAAIGVLIFIILALSSVSLSGILATKPLQFLGSISYSLYLFHALVLKVVVTVFSKVLPVPAVLGISLVLALVIATASWRYIEVPSIQLGKTITKRWYRKVPKRLPEPSP